MLNISINEEGNVRFERRCESQVKNALCLVSLITYNNATINIAPIIHFML